MEVKDMDQYVTGAVIKKLREKNDLTQMQFAEKLGVSDKSVSKWETGKGYPDIPGRYVPVQFSGSLHSLPCP